MNKALDKKMAIIVIVLSTIVMQGHSIPFWQKFTGDYYSGIAFSLALEGAMLWNWYANQRPVVRVLLGALLILGPWYQVSIPVFEDIGTVRTSATLAHSYLEEVEQLKASLLKHETNSKKFRRAADRVEPTQDLLNAARKNYRKEIGTTEKSESSLRLYAVAVIQALAFLALMLTQISAVKFIPRSVSGKDEMGSSSVSEISETIETVAAAISEKMKGYSSQAAFAQVYKFNTRDVSNVINGKPISKRKLVEMLEKLGVEG